MKSLPSISIIIPTYNSEAYLESCLSSIFNQDYPKILIEVFIIDGGSTDNTIEIAKRFKTKIFFNRDRIEEKGRVIGINKAKSELVCFIDADNILPNRKWLLKMIKPFKEENIYGVDTLYYSFRKNDNIITKYCALVGGDDPLTSYLGVNDRFCYFTNKWTGMPHHEENKEGYIKFRLQKNKIPAMGSNGFLIRRLIFDKIPYDPFIHTVFIHRMVNNGFNSFAKVRESLIHIQKNSGNFFMKKIRRIKRRHSKEVIWEDYDYFRNKSNLIKTSLYISSILLPIKDAIIGYSRKPTIAWLFHPIACTGTLLIYAIYSIKKVISYNH